MFISLVLWEPVGGSSGIKPSNFSDKSIDHEASVKIAAGSIVCLMMVLTY